MSTPAVFKWRHFQAEIILLNVRWYCRYALSYRDLEEMMAERGIKVDHSTVNRWVLKYAPELDKRIRPHLHLAKPGMGFGSFNSARRTLRGMEAMNMLRKGQGRLCQ